ncbi:MAG: disulfide bond formation protein DsbA [Actinomycetota bacterium]
MTHAPTRVQFWVDPACPFCWTTARWLVDEVLPHRQLDVTWQPISLLWKNDPPVDSPYYEAAHFTHRLLRVMESVRTTDGDRGVLRIYREFGARIHHDGVRPFDPADALTEVGLDTKHAAAFDDERWDEEIRTRMDRGLELVGTDVGTPIIAIERPDGSWGGYFGPVITGVPSSDKSLRLWDALVEMTAIDEFFELKRTRTHAPNPGDRPNPID